MQPPGLVHGGEAELLELPGIRERPVSWSRAKVNRDWHIQIESISSTPCRTVRRDSSVDVRIIGKPCRVLADGEVIASHQQGSGDVRLRHRPTART